MSFNLVHIWQSMDLFARGVVFALLVMATASLAVFVERIWAYARSRKQSEAFGDDAQRALADGDHAAIVIYAQSYAQSPLAALLSAGAKTYLAARAKPASKVEPIELARRELMRKSESIGADLRRGFGVLASVGSVAPFVGLLGTVVGIIAAFENIAKEGSSGVGAVSAGIAEALVVTALGLVVAIPAVLAFNYLSGKADAIALALEQSRGELIDHLESSEAPAQPMVPMNGVRSGTTRESSSVRREGIKPEMNVTPLVDVVLVLLIIFMVITPQMEKGPTVDVPTIQNVDPKSQVSGDPVTVKITAEGELWIEAESFEKEALLARLTVIHAAEPGRRVILKADRDTPYVAVRGLFKQAQEIGFGGVALQVGERRAGVSAEGG